MDEQRREFLQQFSGRRLARLAGATVFAALDALQKLKGDSSRSPEEAGLALRRKSERRTRPGPDRPTAGRRIVPDSE